MKYNPLIIMAAGFACGVFFSLPLSAISQELETPPSPIPPASDFYAHISGYQPSYFGWVFDNEPHATFQISIQYPFLPFEVFGVDTATPFIGSKSGLYIAYTGRTDMYLSRASAPTISREHNPGLYFDFDRCFNQPMTMALGYFHDSNGQVIDTREKYLAIPAHARDFVSRGWDYLLLGSGFTFSWHDPSNQETLFHFREGGALSRWASAVPKSNQSSLTFYMEGLYFLEKQAFGTAWKEESIFWEDVSEQPHRSDFDGIRATVVLENANYRLADTLRTGYTASHLTNDLSFTFRVGNWLPLSIKFHTGYGPDLSSYYIFSRFLTLGCELYGFEL